MTLSQMALSQVTIYYPSRPDNQKFEEIIVLLGSQGYLKRFEWNMLRLISRKFELNAPLKAKKR